MFIYRYPFYLFCIGQWDTGHFLGTVFLLSSISEDRKNLGDIDEQDRNVTQNKIKSFKIPMPNVDALYKVLQ